MKRKSLISQLKPSSLAIGAGSAVAGTAAADLHGNAEVLPAILCMLFAVMAQLTANLYRSYYIENQKHGQKIGWKLPTVAANPTALGFRISSIVTLSITLMTGCVLVTMGGWWVLCAGAFILIAGWLCAGGPHPIMRSPWSPLATFILFGPVCVCCTALIQIFHDINDTLETVDFTPALYASAVIGLMAVNSNLIYNVKERDFDSRTGRRSAITDISDKTVMNLVLLNGFIFSAIFAISCFTLDLRNPYAGLVAPVFCLLVNIYVWRLMHNHTYESYHKSFKTANLNILFMAALMLAIARIEGEADTSGQTFFGTMMNIPF